MVSHGSGEEVVPGWPQCRWVQTDTIEKVGLLDVPPPLAVIKVHGYGLDWWRELSMPDTWEIDCAAAVTVEGRHYIYEIADGVNIPLASMQDYIVDTVTRHFTGVPPAYSKEWVRQIKPARLTKFPDVPEEIHGITILGTHTPQMAEYGTHLIN